MRRSGKSRFVRSHRHAYRMELVLEFGASVPAAEAKELARKILESLRVTTASVPGAELLKSGRLVCHDLQRVLPIVLPPSPPMPPPRRVGRASRPPGPD